ncbi:hypothetical protein ACFL6H_05285 [Candidatus Latescibacterota bacterium]
MKKLRLYILSLVFGVILYLLLTYIYKNYTEIKLFAAFSALVGLVLGVVVELVIQNIMKSKVKQNFEKNKEK